MPKFNDLISSLGMAEDGISTVYPETFVPDITAAYEADFEPITAKVLVLETELAEANAKILQLQAHNYELMNSAPATGGVVEDQATDDSDDSDADNDDNSGVDSLFNKNDKED